ncbi:hypothetical protein BJ165DRAFT_194726 [Panaeolus papilionaceus]|nr:hypothetical protein BJ165DRAFT_194726 [Panaeolus papilionaceus]
MDSSPSLNTNAPPLIPAQADEVHTQAQWNSRMEPLFFNPSLKLAALRVTLLASAAALGSIAILFVNFRDDINHNVSLAYMGTMALVLVHHLISAFKVHIMAQLLDLVLLIAEIVLLVVFKNPTIPDRFDPTSFIVLFVAGWSVVAFLSFHLMCRFAAILRHRGENLFKPFDLLENAQRTKGIPVAGLPAAYSMLIGRSIWRKQFEGESSIVRLLRGIVAGGFITALFGYGMLSLIIKPIQETALIPVRESRGLDIPIAQFKTIEKPTWNFGFVRYVPPGVVDSRLDDLELFHQAVNVTTLSEPDGSRVPCTHSTSLGPIPDHASAQRFGYDQRIHVSCDDFDTDTLIEVNYEPLGIRNNITSSIANTAVWVYVGYTTNVDFLINQTTAIALPPNVHHLTGVTFGLRKILKRPALSALGMFEATTTFVTADILSIVPDPLASVTPPVYNMSETSSTFRLYLNRRFEIRVIEDSRERSVLGGFSALGGLWTFLGGIFVTLFGTSLMTIFFNSRPLSIFGLAQRVEKDSIAREYLQKYPKIREDLKLPQPERGIMALLQDYLIDVALFEEAIGGKGQATEKQTVHLDEVQVDKAGSGAGTPDIREVTNPSLTYRQ